MGAFIDAANSLVSRGTKVEGEQADLISKLKKLDPKAGAIAEINAQLDNHKQMISALSDVLKKMSETKDKVISNFR